MEGNLRSSAACAKGEEDEAGFYSRPSCETGPTIHLSVSPALGNSPQSSDVYSHDVLPTATTLSYAPEENSAVMYPSESTICSGFGLAKRAKTEEFGLPSKAPPLSQSQVRKLGEKITALQQLVSPFGKTDTASVLLETIGYIKFLQDQVYVLSSPYMIYNGSRKECQSSKDLRSRGLCLVPVSCTLNVASSNGADYWISGIGGRSG